MALSIKKMVSWNTYLWHCHNK